MDVQVDPVPTPQHFVCTDNQCNHSNPPEVRYCQSCGEPLEDDALPAIPDLPDDATPEERQAHWLKYTYRGEGVKQLTLRAVLMGGLLGMVMSISNLYTTLKLGWSFGVAITACLLSFTLWNAVRALSGNRLSKMTILENNCMQSTASAAGFTTGITLGTAFAALLLITGRHTPWQILVPWTLLVAGFGVFLAVPLKRQLINVEQLPFPSGIAAAQTLRTLYGRGREATRTAYALIAAMFVGGLLALLREGPVLFDWLKKLPIHIPQLLPFGGTFWGVPGARLVRWGFEPSVLLIGAGMIVGLRVSLSMLFASFLLYLWIGPALINYDAAHLGSAGYIPSIPLVGDGQIYHLMRWSLWAGTALIVTSSLTSLLLQWKTVARSFGVLRFRQAPTEKTPANGHLEIPTSWMIAGLVPITIGLVILQYFAFAISIPLGILAVVASFFLALVACRVTGEAEVTPAGALGKITQLGFAALARGNTTINLMSASVTASACSSGSDLLIDLKSGHVLGANPRKQFLAQFVGIFFGAAAIIPAWYLMVPNKAALEEWDPPAANMWRAFAEALTQGLDTIPWTAQWAMLIAGGIGIALPLTARFLQRAQQVGPSSAPARFLPSPVGLGLAWVIPFNFVLAFAIGALAACIWRRVHRSTGETYLVPIASGMIAGESITAALIAIAASLRSLFA